MPNKSEYMQYLDGVWDRNWLTNNGPLVKELEIKLKEYLGINNLLLVGNGTIALQIAIKALELKGEIITTPFSYVASTSSIVWENCKPVFADIDPKNFNIDPGKIEEKITDKTSAILTTHVFGCPCDIGQINKIASTHNLKVIYDAAHAFGTKYKGESIFKCGDISATSFHATKIFHTVEGGAIFSQNRDLINKMKNMRNFGHAGFENFNGLGINGKASEFHAAMGLCNLPEINTVLKKRKEQYLFYREKLDNKSIAFQNIENWDEYNFSYFPIIFNTEAIALQTQKALNENEIFPRRYFYPSLDTLDYLNTSQVMHISRDIAKRVLCLPVYPGLERKDQIAVAKIIIGNL